jgi:predicted CoA-binding protein
MIDPTAAATFLTQPRLAVVGASEDPKSFGTTIYKELRGRGNEVVAVNPGRTTVQGDPCYPDLFSVPGDLDGVIVVVGAERAGNVIRATAAQGIPRIWLFKGIGAPGAVSDENVALCERLGLEVVAGACPLMFLEPTAWIHRTHRAFRRLNHSVAKAAA